MPKPIDQDALHDADALRRLERAVRECPEPWRVRIVDTGGPDRPGSPRYRLLLADNPAY